MGLGLGLGLGLSLGGGAVSVKSLLGASLRVWLQGSAVATTGSQVNTMLDQSGNGFNFTGTGSPQVASGAINGHPGVSFTSADSVTCNTVSTTVLNGTSCERIAVFFAPTNNYMCEATFGTTNNLSNIPFTNGSNFDEFGVSTRQSFAKSGTYTVGCIYGSYSAANDFQAYFNGTSIFTNATNTYAASASAGALGTTAGFTLCEYVVANAKLSALTRTALYRLLGAKYGIAVP